MIKGSIYNFFYDLQGSYVQGVFEGEFEHYYIISNVKYVLPNYEIQSVNHKCYINKIFLIYYCKHLQLQGD